MARKGPSTNGHDRLEEALATLIQNQATFNTNQTAFVARMAETDRLQAEYKRQADERFARIEAQMAEIIRVLNEHTRILERLPDVVREKIGFKEPPLRLRLLISTTPERPQSKAIRRLSRR